MAQWQTISVYDIVTYIKRKKTFKFPWAQRSIWHNKQNKKSQTTNIKMQHNKNWGKHLKYQEPYNKRSENKPSLWRSKTLNTLFLNLQWKAHVTSWLQVISMKNLLRQIHLDFKCSNMIIVMCAGTWLMCLKFVHFLLLKRVSRFKFKDSNLKTPWSSDGQVSDLWSWWSWTEISSLQQVVFIEMNWNLPSCSL